MFEACDVALSFGLLGSDIAKSQSAIEIRSDNFTSILAPISFGKNVFRSAKKYLQFLLTSHITLQVVSLLSTATIFQPPMTAMQLLWINVMLDVIAVVALSTGHPTSDLLVTNPYNISDKILTRTMFNEVIFVSFFQVVCLLILLLLSAPLLGLPYDWSTPTYFDENVDTETETVEHAFHDATNKTKVFTMMVHS